MNLKVWAAGCILTQRQLQRLHNHESYVENNLEVKVGIILHPRTEVEGI
jgi:hypothetical protein